MNGAATLPAAVASNPAATPNPAATQAAAAGQPPPGGAAPADGAKPPSLAATLLGKAPLTPSHELPELGANTPQATLSSAARVLTNVLSTAMAGQAGQMAQLALIGKTALFGNAAPDTAELANKLQDTVSKSGLFYESHVAEWVKGERPLADLMREPQMQRLLQQGQESAARAAAGGPDLSAAQMINQQLHTHEQSRVLWNGQAWPGQPMQWEVRRDAREGGKGGGQSDAETEPVWHSGVRFRLPLLGAVSAAVTLIGEQVHIQVQADNAGSADTLRAWAGQLESALAAAGAQLSSLRIDQDDEVAP
ncbi:flagellar hook-length control protein FliK [Duganella lactea]|uniref:flagellar hook-length control protein FliK n=1 Tax=Duganella lactea TaxID=2692173 RepID=UPI00353150A0